MENMFFLSTFTFGLNEYELDASFCMEERLTEWLSFYYCKD